MFDNVGFIDVFMYVLRLDLCHGFINDGGCNHLLRLDFHDVFMYVLAGF